MIRIDAEHHLDPFLADQRGDQQNYAGRSQPALDVETPTHLPACCHDCS
jgi:hypothetical protein